MSSYNPNLPIGEINILMVTDVHSWISGHSHPDKHPHSQLTNSENADYGDVLSFYQHLCAIFHDKHQKDLFFVMNGDFMDGTGLSTSPPTALVDLLKSMPWDLLNVGNHEIYHNKDIKYIRENFIPHWDGGYLTSNVLDNQTGEPWGKNRYKFLRSQFSSRRILSFGFLFDMVRNGDSVQVQKVEEVVQMDWYRNVLLGMEGEFDAIVVLAHMNLQDPSVSVILTSIRDICGSIMPVQFITGHTHHRGFAELDEGSCSMEAGRYLDTLGFVSFPFKEKVDKKPSTTSLSEKFHHVFIDPDRNVFRDILGLGDYQKTLDGEDLSNRIHSARESLGLLKVFGCSPRNYLLATKEDPKELSLLKLYFETIVPQQLFKGNSSKVLIQGVGAFRSDLYAGVVTKDDIVTMSPFDDGFWLVLQRVSGDDILGALHDLNQDLSWDKSKYLTNEIVEGRYYDVYSVDFDIRAVSDAISSRVDYQVTASIPDIFMEETTTTLWIDFLQQNWPCDDLQSLPKLMGSSRHPPSLFFSSLPIMLLVFLMSGLFIRKTICRRKKHSFTFFIPMVTTSGS